MHHKMQPHLDDEDKPKKVAMMSARTDPGNVVPVFLTINSVTVAKLPEIRDLQNLDKAELESF